MLQIKNVTITHKRNLRTIIENFSYVLNPGDKTVIIGEEGNGKSTLLKLIYDPSLVEDYVDYTGEVVKENMKLGYLAQEMDKNLFGRSILEYCEQIPDFYQLSQGELFEAAKAIGRPVDWFYSQQEIGTLSGGEKVKLQLAGLLFSRPDALLLDEPSNDIDIATLEWLESFIREFPNPVLFISHDETLIENTANAVIHLEQLRRKTLSSYTAANVPYAQYIRERENRMAHQEQVARKEEAEYQKQMERYRQIYEKVDHQLNTITRANPSGGRLLKKKMKSVKSMGRRFEREHEGQTQIPDTEEAIFAAFDRAVSIPQGKVVLDFHLDELAVPDNVQGERILARNIELFLAGPKKICIVGENGAGKSTLLRQIAGRLLERADIHAAYMPQNYEDLLNPVQTPVEFFTRTGEREERTRIQTFLGSLKFTPEEMEHPIGGLSGGQKAKLLFLNMIFEGANVLVLDEPTRNFSPLSNPVIRKVLKEFGGAVIGVSHDRKFIGEVCDECFALDGHGLRKMNKA